MSQIVLNGIAADVLTDLTRIAGQNNMSLEEQAKGILTDGIRRRTRLDKADRIAAMTRQEIEQSNSTDIIRGDRDR